MASTIQVRVDNDLKSKSDKLFHDLGTDTTTAIRIFLTQAVANNGFPFEDKKGCYRSICGNDRGTDDRQTDEVKTTC